MKKILKLLSCLALSTGKASVCKCVIWFNQPKVPGKMYEITKR